MSGNLTPVTSPGKCICHRARCSTPSAMNTPMPGMHTTPLIISEARRQWLVAKGYITLARRNERWDGRASHDSGVRFNYSLIHHNPTHWAVYFDYTDPNVVFRQDRGSSQVKYHQKWGQNYEPMLAMTNPIDYRQFQDNNYLNAITGDYDLFAIWPYVKDYNPYGEDYRPLGTTKGFTPDERRNIDHLERNFTQSGQGTKLGNITDRIYAICQYINSIVGRHVLWHSDESARPFLDDVDLPVIAFTPKGDFYCIESIAHFKDFIAICDENKIITTLSNAWAQNPTTKFPNRLGESYADKVPGDTYRTIVPNWYNDPINR